MKRLLTAWLCVLLAASPGAAQTARVGREFEARAGRTVTLDGGRLRLRLVRVAEDSRCPVDVDCVWAGNAEVLVEVGGRGWRGRETLKLDTAAGGGRASERRYGSYTIKLAALSPQPRSGRKLAQRQYTATLLVSIGGRQ